MITNKNICLVHVSSKRTSKSIYDDLRKQKGGVMYMISPSTNEEHIIRYKDEEERKLWIQIKKEEKELLMVS